MTRLRHENDMIFRNDLISDRADLKIRIEWLEEVSDEI